MGICPSARCDRHRSGCRALSSGSRPCCRWRRAHPLLIGDFAALRAPVKEPRSVNPNPYLKGVSTGDSEEALVALLGKDTGGLSASTIGRLKEAWSDEHARWSKRDLSAKRYIYFWVDKTGQRPQQTAEEPATKSQADIWMAETKKEALAAFDAFIETWGVKYDKAAECLIKDRDALLALRFPGRAVEASAHHERHRKCVRHGAPSHHAVQRMSLKQDRARHDLQARRGCRKKLASPQWPQPVAENHPRYKVHRWNRSSQIASSNRCRLIPSVTKIRQ